MSERIAVRSASVGRWRHHALRGRAMALRCLTHPTWAAANFQNYLDQRAEQEYAQPAAWPPATPIEETLAQLTGADDGAIAEVLGHVPRPTLHQRSVLYGNPDASRDLLALTYACCRLLRPNLVVETGVANGYTTAAMLEALAENGAGRLVSIDLPHLHPQAVASVGAAVRPALRARWELNFGSARRLLKTLPLDDQPIDLFVQDAAHTVRGQLAEYRTAWPRLKAGGLLITDDVGPALEIFAAEVGQRPIYVDQPKPSPIGILRKAPSPAVAAASGAPAGSRRSAVPGDGA
jgi:predicted O-methyltransferase YrrM